MPESTLNLTLTELKAGIAEYLSFSRTSTNWDSRAQAQIDAALASGLRQFYFTPLLPGQVTPHEWTFLKPEHRLPIVASQGDYVLPDNFQTIEDDIVLESDDARQYEIRLVSPERINLWRQGTQVDTCPRYAAIKTVTGTGVSTPRYELMVWPTPDQAYTLVFRYVLIPDLIVTAEPVAMCGTQHAETLLASCLACAEKMYLDGQVQKQAEYMRLLSASIARDQAMAAPKLIGTRKRLLGETRYEYRGTGPVRVQGFDY